MAKDTPERFAKLILAELADLHALVLGLHDHIVADISERSGASIEEVASRLESKRDERARKSLSDLLERLDLPERKSE